MKRTIISIVTAASLVFYSTAIARGEGEPVKNAMISVLTGGELCTVYIDGEQVGESPLTVFVTPGKHKVRVVSDSGEVKEKSVKAKANHRTEVRFDFPLPDAVKAALKEDFEKEEEPWGYTKIGMAVAGICVVGGAVMLAIHYGASGGLSSVHVSQQDISLSVRSNLATPDGDRIDLSVNGAKLLDDYVLTDSDHTVGVVLNSGSNLVEIKAENEGTQPPNTGTLTISNVTRGSSVQNWSISAGATARMIIVAP